MLTYFRPAKLAAFFFAAAILGGAAFTAAAQSLMAETSSTLEGTVANVSRDTLAVNFPDGSVKTVSILTDSLVLAREPATLDSIKPNEAVGVASRRESDGSLVADYINIFSPQLWNVVRKGTFPMASGDLMSNEMVTRYVAGVKGRVLYLKYGSETTAINVPEGTRINRLVTERVSNLRPGMHIIIRGTIDPEGDVIASSITYNYTPMGGVAAGRM
jgi:hypothetical protein